MIDEIKKIKLEELNAQIVQYEEKERAINQRSTILRNELSELKKELGGLTEIERFSFLEKWFTKRREYKKCKEKEKRLDEVNKLIIKGENELSEEERKSKEELETLGLEEKISAIKQNISLIDSAKTLYQIGFTPMEAIKFLESKGIQPVLSESDKYIVSHPRDYSSKSSLIGVHKTRYVPTANMIKSAKDSNVEYKRRVIINGIEYQYSYRSARDTVHMAMNDEVSSHFYSWDDCKYAILVPFNDIPNEKIGFAAPMDTFTRGSIELSENAWILCPKNEVESLKKFNPKVHVLGYEGENVQGFSQPFLSQLGYRAESVGMWNWTDAESDEKFNELIEKEGLRRAAHFHTFYHEDENLLASINQAVSLCRLIRDNSLITKPEDIENIMQQLENNYPSFGSILSEQLGKTTEIIYNIKPMAIKANGKHVDVFLEEMRKNGFVISPAYEDVIKKLGEISILNCNNDNEESIFSFSEQASEDEKKAIDELRKVLVLNSDNNQKIRAFGKFLSTAIGKSILESQERTVIEEHTKE